MVHRNAPLTRDRAAAPGPVRRRRRLAAAPGRGTVPGLAHHRGPVGGPLPPAGAAGMADRPSPAPVQPGPHPAADRTPDHRPAGQQAARPGPDRLPARPGALDRARGAAPLRLPAADAPGPGHRRRSAATNATGPASWSTSTSRSSATSPTAAAGASWARPAASTTTRPPHPAATRTSTATRSWATATCTPPSTTTPGWPTPRSCPTRPRTPPPRSGPRARLVRRRRHHHRTRADRQRLLLPLETWATTCSDLGIIPKRTRPYRPQTNGKVERFQCATRRPVVSPVQPGGTRREVPGSDGLPGSER